MNRSSFATVIEESVTLEIELVDRIRGVRDKFAQEDLTIRVDRVDHEIEQFLALSFELLHV